MPDASIRQALIERTRFMTDHEVERSLALLGPVPVQVPKLPPKRNRKRVIERLSRLRERHRR